MYSTSLIETILTAAGIPASPYDLVQNTQMHCYYYSHQAMTEQTLWRDQWEYICSQKGQIQNRCVIFLIESKPSHYAAIVLLLSDINDKARRDCLNFLSDQTEHSLTILGEESSSSHPLQRLLSVLYQRVQCWFLGDVSDLDLVNRWGQALQAIYAKGSPKIQVQPLSNQNPDIMFTECLLRLVRQQSIGEVFDIPQIVAEHHQLCHPLLSRSWEGIQQRQPAIFAQLADFTRRLLKYAKLQTLRQSYADYISKADYTQLSMLLAQDLAQKMCIYSETISDILPSLKQLSFPTVAGLLAYREPEKITELIQLLQGECQKQQAQVKAWEEDLARIMTRMWHRGDVVSLIGRQIYQNSFVGLGAELTPVLGSWGLYAVGLANTLSPAEQHRLLTMLKWFGGGLGAYYTGATGSYHLAKSVFTGSLSRWMNDILQRHRLDDVTATIRAQWPIGTVGLSRMLHIGIAAVESIWSDQLNPLIQTTGGVLGSMLGISLAQFFANVHMLDGQPISNDTAAILFFSSLAGYEMGRLFANTLHQGVNKILIRGALPEAFCALAEQKQINYQGCVADFSATSAWSPSFWMSSQETVRLGWSNQMNEFYEANCDVIPISTDERAVMCGEPMLQTTKRLG
jgi:hypothetical protein